MTLSSSGSVSSLRSTSSKGHFHHTRLARIEESKYEKHQQQQQDDRKGYVTMIIVSLTVFVLWKFISISRVAVFQAHQSFDESRIHSLRHSKVAVDSINTKDHAYEWGDAKGDIYTNEKGGSKWRPVQLWEKGEVVVQKSVLVDEQNSNNLDEKMALHIQELREYQPEETIQRDYQEEAKAQMEEELMNT